MGECVQKVTVEICAETACNAIAKRVANGMKVATACKEVASDYNKENEAIIKWQSLRKAYNRANNDEKRDTVPLLKKAPNNKELPMIEAPPKYAKEIKSLREGMAKLREDNAKLEETNATFITTMTDLEQENKGLRDELHELKQPQMKPSTTWEQDRAGVLQEKEDKLKAGVEYFKKRREEESDV